MVKVRMTINHKFADSGTKASNESRAYFPRLYLGPVSRTVVDGCPGMGRLWPGVGHK